MYITLSQNRFYKTQEFLKLQSEWNEKLRKSGFEDVEDSKGRLKQYDRRTVSWENRDRIREFFISLDHYLTETQDIPPNERKILTFYSEGRHLTEICKLMRKGRTTIKEIIKKYKRILTT